MTYRLIVNDTAHEIDAPGDMPLLYALRNHLDLKATRYGCGLAECGACAVFVGRHVRQSCVLPLAAVDGPITTVEGLAPGDALSPVQQAFIDEQAAQCGYCISGMMIAATALLAATPDPDDAAIAASLTSNLCGCGVDAWLAIDAGGRVTIYSGKVELGTGVATALRQLAAGGLDVAFADTRLVQADTALTPDLGYTAGSKTLQSGGTQLAHAARLARAALIERAAAHLGVAANTLTTARGHVVGNAALSAQRLPYAALIADGIDLPLDAELPAFAPGVYRGPVGQSIAREDIPAKIAGRFTYMQDLVVPGMWHGRVIRPPTTGAFSPDAARLIAIDASDLPEAAHVVRVGRFVGVVAASEWQAMQAAERLRLTWDTTMTVPAGDALFAHLETLPATRDVIRDTGPAALGSDAHTATYHWPFQSHDSIGPSAAIADVGPDGVHIWSGTQGVYPLRAALVELLGRDDIRVSYVEASGCYGHNGADDAAADAALLSRAVGRPVRVQWSRADEHGWAPLGCAMRMRLGATLGNDGAITAWQFDNRTPTHLNRPAKQLGAASLLAGQLARDLVPDTRHVGGDRNTISGYDLKAEHIVVNWLANRDMPLRSSALRTLGAIQNTFANESFMDELAHAAGQDPLAFSLAHLHEPRARRVLETAAHAAGWQAGEARPGTWQATGAHGRGMAQLTYENNAARVAAVVAVVISETGIRVTRAWVAHDCGRIVNPDGLRNQIEGNVIQAINRTLNEAITFDPYGITSLEWSAYPLADFAALPEIDITLIDRPDQPILGAGEATSAAIPAAIANAVHAACGLRLRTVPFKRGALMTARREHSA